MFEKNLQYIDNIELKAELAKISINESSQDLSYCMTPSNDYLLMKNDVPLDDLNDPKQAIKNMLRNTIKNPMAENDIIITFGIGLGYLLDETFNAYPSKIFVYEPDIKLLHFVLSNVDIHTHLESGRVYVTTKLDDLIKKLDSTFITKDRVEIVYLKNYAVVKNEELLLMTQKVYETCKSKMIDINTITKFSKDWLVNTITNISTINKKNVYNLSDLERKFSGQTALILAPGPSLSENLKKIKQNRNKYVIFAVNKVLRTLYDAQIIPDFAVCLDAVYVENTLAGLDDYLSKVSCIFNLKSDKTILSKNFRRFFVTYQENEAILKNFIRYNSFIKPMECGGSSTTMAFMSALLMGFTKIVFSGLDLAFKDDVMYSNGETMNKVSDDEIQFDSVKKSLVKVKSVNGGEVLTREDYAATIHHFEQLILNAENQEVYNTTSFGAYIEGMKYESLENIPAFQAIIGMDVLIQDIQPIKLEVKEWSQEELFIINNTINVLAKGNFSPVLVSSVINSPLLYQYMQADVLKVMQSQFSVDCAEDFLAQTKTAIKNVVDLLQTCNLI